MYTKRTIFFTLFIFISLSLHAVDWAEIINRTGPSIGRVLIKDSRGSLLSQGTGFLIEDPSGKQIFVTNAHVIRDAWYNKTDTITIAFDYGNINKSKDSPISATIDQYDQYLDLGLLSLSEDMDSVLKLNQKNDYGLMTEIVVAGYPLGKNFKATLGRIQAFQSLDKWGDMIDMSANLAPGNSGGPVLDQQGDVIGIATAVIQGYNFNFAIPVENLFNFLDYENNMVSLRIQSEPGGSRVFINGDYKGETPISLDLFNKQYNFKIEKEGYESLQETIGPWENIDNPVLKRSLSESGKGLSTIWISTDPIGADIFVGNTKIGISPISVQMPPGRILRIRANKKRSGTGSLRYKVTNELEQHVTVTLD